MGTVLNDLYRKQRQRVEDHQHYVPMVVGIECGVLHLLCWYTIERS